MAHVGYVLELHVTQLISPHYIYCRFLLQWGHDAWAGGKPFRPLPSDLSPRPSDMLIDLSNTAESIYTQKLIKKSSCLNSSQVCMAIIIQPTFSAYTTQQQQQQHSNCSRSSSTPIGAPWRSYWALYGPVHRHTWALEGAPDIHLWFICSCKNLALLFYR